jgi:chemosensory pili system protein ChpA (sensor histidine kinase/response regulator)
MSILVVDDQPAIRDMFAALLGDEGYTVACAANGKDALDYLRQAKELPGLILLDIAMPVMTGWGFLREQRQDATLASIPVILMTARGHFEQEEVDVHAAHYIHKPTDLDTLLGAIRYHYAAAMAG